MFFVLLYLVISQHRVEYILILIHKAAMRWTRLVPVKHGMASLMIALKEAKIKAEAIPVYMYHK